MWTQKQRTLPGSVTHISDNSITPDGCEFPIGVCQGLRWTCLAYMKSLSVIEKICTSLRDIYDTSFLYELTLQTWYSMPSWGYLKQHILKAITMTVWRAFQTLSELRSLSGPSDLYIHLDLCYRSPALLYSSCLRWGLAICTHSLKMPTYQETPWISEGVFPTPGYKGPRSWGMVYDSGMSRLLQNVNNHPFDYMASHPRLPQ